MGNFATMSNDLEDDHHPRERFSVSEYLWGFLDKFRTYHLLLWPMLVMFIIASLVLIATSKSDYMATAVVGPSVSLDAISSSSSLQGVARRFKVGSLLGQQNGDPFDEYVSLLTSNRLAERLAREPGLLAKVFAEQWDSKNNRWYTRGSVLDDFRRLLHRPIKPSPDADDLAKYLASHLATSVSLETSYATVSFDYMDRQAAESILNLILLDADNIIRDDKRRDVAARISYLTRALGDITLTDQKMSIIGTLTDQQQEMMIIQSDQRFASTLIDPPHAPFRPVSPDPLKDLMVSIALAILLWAMLIYFARPGTVIYRFIEIFALRRRI